MRLIAPVELSVAADPSMMLVIRLTAAGVIARAGLTVDAMDNLKMAAEESCSCLISQSPSPDRLTLRFSCAEDHLSILISAGDAAPTAPIDETELEIVRCILAALADEVIFDMQNNRLRAIELRANLV